MELMNDVIVDVDEIGRILKERRLALKMTQREASEKIGVTQAEISYIENGKHRLLSLNVLAMMCVGLGIDIHDMIIFK